MAVVWAITSSNWSLEMKFTLSRLTWRWRERGSVDWPTALVTNMLSRPTATTPAKAVPNAVERLLATPRNAPTSPASDWGADVTMTLNSSVSNEPSPRPTMSKPRMTIAVPQLLPTTNDSNVSPPATRAKATMAIRRGVKRS